MADTDTDAPTARPFVPERGDLADLKQAALGCRGCHLHETATQTVFGRGDASARLVFVGEQPGDVEDQKGLPFVGPAGHLLRRAVDDVGIDPAGVYITNAVKHFKFTQSAPGRRRIHQTPERVEITACRPWLVAEFARLTRVRLIVALGATAGQALLGPNFRVTRMRGQLQPWPASAHQKADFTAEVGADTQILATLHPSAILRADNRDEAYAGFVADLKIAADILRP